MATFHDANQVRVALKMKLSVYAWYSSCAITQEADGYSITVVVKKLDNAVRRLIAPVIDGVSIKTELE